MRAARPSTHCSTGRAAAGVIGKINLKVRPDNAAALALYRSRGFVREGMARRGIRIDGVFRDQVLMGLEVEPTVVREAQR